jgi:hypothetical protein
MSDAELESGPDSGLVRVDPNSTLAMPDYTAGPDYTAMHAGHTVSSTCSSTINVTGGGPYSISGLTLNPTNAWTTGSYNSLVGTISAGAINAGAVGSSGSHNSGVYTINGAGSPWTTQSPTSTKIQLDGENADITVNGWSLVAAVKRIEDRLGLYQPNPELESEWEDLQALGEQYRKLEQHIRDKQATWDRLKAMPPPAID